MLLRRRAQEIVELAEKTEQEFARRGAELSGEISIGAGETRGMNFLSAQVRSFRALHPQVRFRIHSANADDIKERLENGLLDMGLLVEPVEIGRYAFLRLPQRDRWGVLVPKDSPLAQLDGGDAPGPGSLAPSDEQPLSGGHRAGELVRGPVEPSGSGRHLQFDAERRQHGGKRGWASPWALIWATCPTSCALCPWPPAMESGVVPGLEKRPGLFAPGQRVPSAHPVHRGRKPPGRKPPGRKPPASERCRAGMPVHTE